MSTILERAKNTARKSVKNPLNDERIEAGLAWLRGDVTITQLSIALGGIAANTNIYIYVALGLREAFRRGLLVEKTTQRAAK
jgi:hypothetical protein